MLIEKAAIVQSRRRKSTCAGAGVGTAGGGGATCIGGGSTGGGAGRKGVGGSCLVSSGVGLK